MHYYIPFSPSKGEFSFGNGKACRTYLSFAKSEIAMVERASLARHLAVTLLFNFCAITVARDRDRQIEREIEGEREGERERDR